jgi:hypothetical protein
VQHCTAVGTVRETGQVPYMAEFVGAALLPLIDRAIDRLIGERLSDWEDEAMPREMSLLPARLGIGSKWTCWRLLRHVAPLYPAPTAWRLSQLAPPHHQN